MQSRWLAAVAALSAALCLSNAAWSAWSESATYDESYHLDWSRRLLDEGVSERASRARFNSKTPVNIPNVLAEKLAVSVAPENPRLGRLAARLPTVGWLAALLLVVFRLGCWLAGPAAGALALIGTALDPNLAAHGSLVTVDVAYAAATAGTLWAALAYARSPSLGRAALLGLGLGIALATKFTAVLLLAGLAFLPLAAPAGRSLLRARLVVDAAAAAVTALLVLAAAYLFLGWGRPLGELPLGSTAIGALARRLPGLRLPLPEAFLTGLAASLASERTWGPIVILGRSYPDGVFFYFPVLWLLKTPLALLALQGAGLLWVVASRRLWREPTLRFLTANLLLTLAYFLFLFRTQIGYRFVLMLVPLAWLLAAVGLATWAPRRLSALASTAFVLALLESVAYVGNPLSFTNSLVWPKRDAYRYVADSNIDWGQNRDRIDGWLAERGVSRSRLDPVHVLAGTNVFGLNVLAGVFDADQHRWVREHLEPAEQLGHTYLVYDVSYEAFWHFLDAERRWSPDPYAANVCASRRGESLTPPARVAFEGPRQPEPGRLWITCVRALGLVDLGFRLDDGAISVGRLRPGRRCEAVSLVGEKVLWTRLEPGVHALCALETPNRRAWLPNRVYAEWLVRGNDAELSVEPAAAPR